MDLPFQLSQDEESLKGFVQLRRGKNGEPLTNVAHVKVYHSPDGFEWGYAGSGPAELALNILHIMLPLYPKIADLLHQQFKEDFIATMPKEGGSISVQRIREWISDQERKNAQQRKRA